MMKRKHRGALFIVSAPSGAGKTSLCQKLASVVPNLHHSVSYTTRPPRPGEVNNRDYSFVSERSFRSMASRGAFVEWAQVHGYLYGTSRKRLTEMLGKGIDVILDIDTQGAQQLRKKYKEAVYIFILPPSLTVLRKRLLKRMSNSPEEIRRRMRRAMEEIRDYLLYDYVIINNVFDEALEELEAIIKTEGRRTDKVNPQWVKRVFRI